MYAISSHRNIINKAIMHQSEWKWRPETHKNDVHCPFLMQNRLVP